MHFVQVLFNINDHIPKYRLFFFFFNYIVSLVFGSLFSNMLPGKYKNGF